MFNPSLACSVHIKAQTPHRSIFLNINEFYSINVSVIRNSQKHMFNMLACRLGEASDSFKLHSSSLAVRLDEGAAEDGCLITSCQAVSVCASV